MAVTDVLQLQIPASAEPITSDWGARVVNALERASVQTARMYGEGVLNGATKLIGSIGSGLTIDIAVGVATVGEAGTETWVPVDTIANVTVPASQTNAILYILKDLDSDGLPQFATSAGDDRLALVEFDSNGSAVTSVDNFPAGRINHEGAFSVGVSSGDRWPDKLENKLANGTYITWTKNNSGGDETISPEVNSSVPRWIKVTKSYTDFSTAATTNNIEVYSLPAGGIIHAVKIKHSTPFTGGAISAYTISVGITGTLNKYANAFNVFQAAGGTVFQLSTTVGSEDHGSATSIKAAAASTSANLNAATAGSVDIWLLVSVAV